MANIDMIKTAARPANRLICQRRFPARLSLIVFWLCCLFLTGPARAQDAATPNILLIISDDQRYGTVQSFMPATQARIFDEGVTFTNAYVTTPLCCPSRSSILTGLFARNHGVLINADVLNRVTIVDRLHQAGYFTGLVGKYLNSWNGAPRPEFDFWTVFPLGAASYNNPILYRGSVPESVPGYITDILQTEALRFLDLAKGQSNPFFLIFAPNAPHGPAIPHPLDAGLYRNLAPYRPPSFLESNFSGRPLWLKQAAQSTQVTAAEVDAFRLNQLRTLASLDRAVEALLNYLEIEGLLENTVVVYISDNGVMWGEHGLWGKNCMFEEAIHVPLAIRFPKGQFQKRVVQSLVANIDLTPTFVQLSKVSFSGTDGASLFGLLSGQFPNWRTDLLIEGFQDADRAPFQAVHGSRYVYVENTGDLSELYDLQQDPFQLANQAANPAYAQVKQLMQQKFETLTGHPAQGDAAVVDPTPVDGSGSLDTGSLGTADPVTELINERISEPESVPASNPESASSAAPNATLNQRGGSILWVDNNQYTGQPLATPPGASAASAGLKNEEVDIKLPPDFYEEPGQADASPSPAPTLITDSSGDTSATDSGGAPLPASSPKVSLSPQTSSAGSENLDGLKGASSTKSAKPAWPKAPEPRSLWQSLGDGLRSVWAWICGLVSWIIEGLYLIAGKLARYLGF